tara:strand:- start:9776 stop:10276 length:501 start_codon:yes stop_codon:yes gene_type:complete
MPDISWVKDLVRYENEIEESGMVDINAGFDSREEIIRQSYDFMFELKKDFIDYINAFNELKGGGMGCVKVYGISNTKSDFMLFRNGYKLIFRLVEAGRITISSRSPSANITPGALVQESQEQTSEEELLAQWGAFGELKWTYKNQILNPDYLVRYYLSRFIRESAK